MTLGIPGDGITAIMLGALIIQGLAPGPLLFIQHAAFAYTMIASFFFALVSTAIIALSAFTIVWPFIMEWRKRRRGGGAGTKTEGS